MRRAEPDRARRGGRSRRSLGCAALVCVAPAALSFSGCSGVSALPIVADIDLPKIPVPQVLHIEDTTDKPTNLIERALSGCDKRVEAGEADCLKKAVTDAHLTVPALVSMVHGCRLGQICHYDYTTEDVVGFDRAIATHYAVHWRASFDLTHAPATIEAVPISVVQAS